MCGSQSCTVDIDAFASDLVKARRAPFFCRAVPFTYDDTDDGVHHMKGCRRGRRIFRANASH